MQFLSVRADLQIRKSTDQAHMERKELFLQTWGTPQVCRKILKQRKGGDEIPLKRNVLSAHAQTMQVQLLVTCGLSGEQEEPWWAQWECWEPQQVGGVQQLQQDQCWRPGTILGLLALMERWE